MVQKEKVKNTLSPSPLSNQGFTIVELLIVIVVIAILAAITVVAFNGVSTRAVESALQTDLKNNSTSLEVEKTNLGAYPTTGSAANNGQGLKVSGDNSLSYSVKPYGYCMVATNTRTAKSYSVKSSDKKVAEGDCNTTVGTFAGSGVSGFNDSPTGTSAQFAQMMGIAADGAGNLYVAETNPNHRVRKIDPSGAVSTLAGNGTFGSTNGASATFGYLYGIAATPSGTIYVLDNGTAIRKITPSGFTSLVAGGVQGYLDGVGAAARFNASAGIALDANENLYVADTQNHRIRKVAPDGTVTTVAGSGVAGYADGLGTAAQFSDPYGLAVTPDGVIYVNDSSNNRIRKITTDGNVTTLAGSGTYATVDGVGTAASFRGGYSGLSVDGYGNIFIAEFAARQVRMISPAGVVTTVAGTGSNGYQNGSGATAQFSSQLRQAVPVGSNTLYVVDGNNYRIRSIAY